MGPPFECVAMNEVSRRDTLKLLAAGGAGAACTPRQPSEENMSEKHRLQASAGDPALSPTSENPILRTRPLPRLGPWPTPDPFLFCVHHLDHYPAGNERLGPAVSLSGRNIGQDFEGKDGWNMYHGRVVPGFPAHPHRGFETVTVVRRGLLDHADSLGAAARYGEGDVQWLTAGAGIQHAEMFPLLHSDKDNALELFQIWLNLPAAKKMATPHFTMLWSDTIPTREFRDADGKRTRVTLRAGRLGDVAPPAPPPESWAAQPGSEVAIWEIQLDPGARWTLPAASAGLNRALYFFQGSELRVAGRPAAPRHQLELRPDVEVELECGSEPTELLLLQGRPIGEPVAQHGPFVMNTHQELQQAFFDYSRTRFGGWPWESDAPVHGREPVRFARLPDGTVERPAGASSSMPDTSAG